MLSLIQLDPAHPMHPVEAGNSLLHSTGVLAGRLEAMLRPAAMCGIILLLCMHLSASQAAVQNESAVSQTYESVHLTEAARKAKGDEGSLEDLLHWAIENSDPEQLKQQAEIVGRENMDLSDRQKEVQQVQPSGIVLLPTSACCKLGVLLSCCVRRLGSTCNADDQRYESCPN